MKPSANTCETCGAPDRVLWGPIAGHPDFTSQDVGNWIELAACDDCRALWCSSPYEPYASFKYSAFWRHSPNDWRLIHDSDDGATMRDWLTGFIHDSWRNLPAQDQAAIEKHDNRANGHSPIRGLYKRSVELETELAALRDT